MSYLAAAIKVHLVNTRTFVVVTKCLLLDLKCSFKANQGFVIMTPFSHDVADPLLRICA